MRAAVALVVVLALASCAAPEPAVIDVATEHVRTTLKDPRSAEFRRVYAFQLFDSDVVCGEVNAKNAMGGYVGFTPFRTTRDAGEKFGSVDLSSDARQAQLTILSCGFFKTYAETHGTPGTPATDEQVAELTKDYQTFVGNAARRVVYQRR